METFSTLQTVRVLLPHGVERGRGR